ncbi:hypothetical protein J7K99_06940 [bacterium]|nr:hypothetical protein [bacterium]
MEKYWRPALIAGAVGGLVSSIPVNNFFCILIIPTVIWAAYMYKKENGYVDIGPGAALGAITGGIASFIRGFLSLEFQIVSELRNYSKYMIMYGRGPTCEKIIGVGLIAIVAIVVFTVVGALVGLIMGAIWQKPKTPPAPSGSVIDAEATVEDSRPENTQE